MGLGWCWKWVCFAPPLYITFFHSKLLSDNCKFHIMKDKRLDIVSKMEGKTNFRGAQNSLMAWPDWPRPTPPLISRRISAIAFPIGWKTMRIKNIALFFHQKYFVMLNNVCDKFLVKFQIMSQDPAQRSRRLPRCLIGCDSKVTPPPLSPLPLPVLHSVILSLLSV